MRIVNPGESSPLYGYDVCSLHPLDRGVAVVSLLLAFNLFATASSGRMTAPAQDGALSLAAPESITIRNPETSAASASKDEISSAFVGGATTPGSIVRLAMASNATAPSTGLPAAAPRSVGMSAERLAAIDRVVARGVKAGGYPGAAVVVGRKGSSVWEKGFGYLDWDAKSQPVIPESSIYDLASLTKVIGTTTALMVLYDEGKIQLDDPVTKYIPAFSGGWKDSVTLRHLLTHRSGLPAGRDLWRVARSPEEARQMVVETPLEARPGSRFEYSDLGADMLGFVVEAVSGKSLDTFLEERVYRPLGMTDTFFKPADSLRARIAPTEVTPPRGYPLRGEVHDENAYALGGVAGHAGLFSTAADLSIFAQMMLNGGVYNGVRIVADSTVRLFTTRAAVGTRALGWDTCDNNGGCGSYLSDRAYGHTGFTGTSIWIDPDREMFVILLTNRVHAARARQPAKVISDVRADLADAAALAVTDGPDGVLAWPASFRADRAVGWNRPERPVRSRRSRGAGSHRKHSRAHASKAKSSHRSSAKKAPAKHATSKSVAKKPAAKKKH
jgi:CubicO group peptidase (beta-lactamase class C family)